jgi:hypothetical protein
MPRPDLGKRIGANEEENPVARIRCFDPLDCIDRIAARLPFLEPRRRQMRISRTGQFHHAIAIRPGCALDALLVRRVPVGDHQHTIQSKSAHRLARHLEVRRMNRVEGAAEDGQALRHQGSRLIRMLRK